MKKKLHILFLNSWYPSRVMPTNGDFIQRHAEAVAIDHQVTAIHIISDQNSQSTLEITDETINGIRTLVGYVRGSKNPILKYVRFIKSFRSILQRLEHFDMVHVNRLYPLGAFALYLKHVKHKPFIISEHWTDYKPPLSKKIGFIEKYVSKLITKNASFVCPVTDDLKKAMQNFGLKGNYKKVPNVVDTNLFVPSKVTNDVFTIVHISNMIDAHKNISGILRVFAQISKKHPDIKIKFIGNGDSQYSNIIDELNISADTIEILNHLSHQELVKHIQRANLLVLFSNYENLPCVILEAFSCGTSVLSTDVGGIKEYFPNGFGKLIRAKDEGQLASEIEKFYKKAYPKVDKADMHEYVEKNFSKEQLCNAFTKLYFKSLTN